MKGIKDDESALEAGRQLAVSLLRVRHRDCRNVDAGQMGDRESIPLAQIASLSTRQVEHLQCPPSHKLSDQDRLDPVVEETQVQNGRPRASKLAAFRPSIVVRSHSIAIVATVVAIPILGTVAGSARVTRSIAGCNLRLTLIALCDAQRGHPGKVVKLVVRAQVHLCVYTGSAVWL